MPDAMSFAGLAAEPDSIDCGEYSRSYEWDDEAGDYALSLVVLHVKYFRAGSLAAHRDIPVNHHAIRRAMISIYDEAREPVYQVAHDAAYQPAYDAAIASEFAPVQAEKIARKAANEAGEQAVVDAGIVPGDSAATWSNVETAVGNNIAPVDALRILSSKTWGELLIRKAWAKERVG